MRLPALVLCYHAISDEWTDGLAVPARALEGHVTALLRIGYRGAPSGAPHPLPPGTLHVTFDDAYRSVRAVLPTLRRLGVPVSIFAATAFADDGGVLDIPELRGRADGREDELSTMTWDMLAAAADEGVTIGSHSVSHPHLPSLSDDALRRELRESRQRIEDRLRRPCLTVAYPFGEHDARVRAAATAAGYAVGYGLDRPGGDIDRFAVPRIDVYRADSRARVIVKALPTGRPVVAARRALRSLAAVRRNR